MQFDASKWNNKYGSNNSEGYDEDGNPIIDFTITDIEDFGDPDNWDDIDALYDEDGNLIEQAEESWVDEYNRVREK